MKFFKENVLTMFTKIMTTAFGMLSSIILARTLIPQLVGFYTILTLIPSVIFILVNLGIDQSIIYFASRKIHSDRETVSNSVFLGFVLGGVSGGLFLLASLLFPMHELQHFHGLMLMIAITVPTSLITANLNSFLVAKGRIFEFNAVNALNIGLITGLQFIFLVIIKARARGLSMAFFAFFVGNTAGLAALLLITGHNLRPSIPGRKYIKEIIPFGFIVFIGQIFSQLIYRVDVFLVGFILNSEAVGFYSYAVKLVEKLWMISATVQITLYHKICTADCEEKELDYTARVCRNVLVFSVFCAVVMGILARWAIVFMFGSAYIRSVNSLYILLPGVIGLTVNKVLAPYFLSRGKPVYTTVITFFSLIMNVGLNILWIPRLKIEGAALASTVSYLFSMVCFIFVAVRIFHFRIKELLIPDKRDLRFYMDMSKAVIARYSARCPRKHAREPEINDNQKNPPDD